jgi:two-component system sensor histidine kinase KdpD
VAHELRAPLAAIKGFTTLLLDYADRLDPAERRQMLEEIDAATERMHELIDSLLDLTRLQAGMLPVRREPVDLATVLRRAVAEAAVRHPARAFHLEVPPALPTILGDARRLGQVVQNLLDNAVRYSPSESPVAVRAWRTADGGVAFAVTDRGIGIAPEHHDRIFTPFYRVSKGVAGEEHGCGLGLAICRGLVEAHGGSITVDSQASAGATFTVRLPAGRAPAEA